MERKIILFYVFSKWSHSRKFAKLNKVPLATFHFEIVPLSGYNDDRFTKEDTFSICEENLPKTRRLYNKLGFDRVSQIFPIHLEKAQIVPTSGIRTSGFLY